MKYLVLVISFSVITLFGYSGGIDKIIQKGDVEKLQKFFDKGGDINEELVFNEELYVHPLSYAVGEEQLAIVKWFVEHKDKLDNVELRISEAFVLSISNEADDISNFLYAQKPDINGKCKNCHKHNALQVAIVYGKLDWYNKLKPQTDLTYLSGNGNNLMHLAASGPNSEIFHDVLEIEGMDLNLKNNIQMTPLDYAAGNESHPAAYEFLVDKGADISAAWNILYFASTGISEYILTEEIIETRSKDLWTADEDNGIPLDMALYPREATKDYEEVQIYMINWLLFEMVDDIKKNGLSSGFQESYFEGKNMLYSMAYISSYLGQDIEDEDQTNIVQHYLEFVGVVKEAGGNIPLYKSDYKYIKKLWGEDIVNDWYLDNDLYIP